MRHCLHGIALGSAVLLGATFAHAQGLRAPAAPDSEKSSYVEKRSNEGANVTFIDDPLSAMTGEPLGSQFRGMHAPRRFDLMRPRTTFVPDMLKSVEAM